MSLKHHDILVGVLRDHFKDLSDARHERPPSDPAPIQMRYFNSDLREISDINKDF